MRAFIAILSGSTSTNSSAPNSPTSPTTPTTAAAATTTATVPNTNTIQKPSHSRSSSILSIGGLMADTVHHEVKLVRYTQHVAQYHSDSSYSDDDDYNDDTKSEKEVQRFFDRDWDQHDWDADAEVWEEPDWSQRVREDRRLTNSRKEARI